VDPAIPDTVLVAPDSFKGTLSAGEVADAIGAGLRAAGAKADLSYMRDGKSFTVTVTLGQLSS